MKKILSIEDDAALALGIKAGLEAEGFAVTHIADGTKGYATALQNKHDAILLDLMLPGKNGTEICRDLRLNGIDTPIIMLTSRAEETDRVVGLEIGADDFVAKPFSMRELAARLKAVLRRTEPQKKPIPAAAKRFQFSKFEVDFDKEEVLENGKPIRLSVKEFEVLRHFILNEGKVVTREDLLGEVWGYHVFPDTRTVDNYVLALRKKFEVTPAEPNHFLKVPTKGYKFVK
ncbi:MAG: response regulator transcription factor [Chloroherpetonaceae bacterium]|nr:response regulator transcription factor [Chloroherpetonaceae bacterium]